MKSNNSKTTTKLKKVSVEKLKFGGVVKKPFTRKGKLHIKGETYNALNKSSLEYLINIGLLESLKK